MVSSPGIMGVFSCCCDCLQTSRLVRSADITKALQVTSVYDSLLS
jgi:hypothetical protein